MLSHEAKALESDVNSLLGGWCDLTGKITEGINVPAKLEEKTLSIGDVNTSVSANSPLELEVEKRECRQNPCSHYDVVLDDSFSSDFNDQESYQLDYDFPKIEEHNNCVNINLSHLPEQQKYLKVTPSDNDDSIKLETINGKEYFVRLKELEMNEDGEFMMTLSPSSGGSFGNQVTALLGYDNLLLSDKKLRFDNTDEQATQLSKNGFTRIDGALANIFNNLIIKV